MSKLYDIIIIGAGPAGLSAAICAGRAKLRTLVLDAGRSGFFQGPNSQVLNYPGIPQVSNMELLGTMRAQAQLAGAEIREAEVSGVDVTGEIKTVFAEGEEYRSVALIAATGVHIHPLGFDGEAAFTGRGVTYSFTYDESFFENYDVILTGNAESAARLALFLSSHAKRVFILSPGEQLGCSKAYLNRVLERSNVEILRHTRLVSVCGDKLLRKAVVVNSQTEETLEIRPVEPATALQVFVFNGYSPNSHLFHQKVTLTQDQYIATDDEMRTDVEGVFAAGDVRPKTRRLLTTAVSDGSVAAFYAVAYVHTKKHDLNLQVAPQSAGKPPAGRESKYFDPQLLMTLLPVLNKLERPICLRLIINDNPVSNDMREFLFDFAAQDPRIQVECLLQGDCPEKEEALGTTLFPVIAVLDPDGADTGIYFHGVPNGHEFTSFVLALYNVAGPGQQLEPETLAAIQRLEPHDLIIGVSLTCTVCPDSVQAAQLLACHNPGIRAHMVDLYQFTSVREAYRILSVPAMIIDGKEMIFGRKRLEDMIEILQGYEKRTRSV